MQKYEKYLISSHSSVRDAITVINGSGEQVALILNGKRLSGIVTDGDVRRGLLNGFTLESSVSEIMRRDYHWLLEPATSLEALSLMKSQEIFHVPVLNQNRELVDLYLYEDLMSSKKIPNAVIIMAGGRGERLGEHTYDCPKPMLMVGGKPMLEIVLRQCIDQGFENFFISVNYLKNVIKDYFRDGEWLGVDIKYIEEFEPLGTAGSLSLLPKNLSEPFFVLNGDILCKVNHKQLLRFHYESGADATICIYENTTQLPFGVIETQDGKVTKLDEKPLLRHKVNAGIYVLDPKTLGLLTNTEWCDMPQLLHASISQGLKVCAFPLHEYWLDVGVPDALLRANGEWN